MWQDYFHERIANPDKVTGSKEDHATAGGILLEDFVQPGLLLEVMQMAIYSHHGLQDAFSLEDDISLFERRKDKVKKLPINECREHFYMDMDEKEIQKKFELAKIEAVELKKHIQNVMKSWNEPKLYGNRDFYLGLYERLIMSLLIDADRRNTEDFMSNSTIEFIAGSATEGETLQNIWKECEINLERKIAGFTDKSGINAYRSEISDLCKSMAEKPYKLYRLTVSTGAGKTLSSLRFAIAHAIKYHKKRIIYVAPFNSITEQNADEIRNALGVPGIVLEHHCNIILETEEEQARYDRLTEDWSSPVVVTTAVQFLNTLFAGKTSNVRRMNSLCNSIIIMDEVQALPIKVLELFNMATNFLTEFIDTTVILCTATQPLLDQVPRNCLRLPNQMIISSEEYREKLRRTELVDCTALKAGGITIDEAAELVLEKAQQYRKVLFIVNTKACARNIYRRLKKMCGEEVNLAHLSTHMCPEHRRDTLKDVKYALEFKYNDIQICISTNLIEAGVDISFRCVVRSLAGLDSLIQAAGRCNRHAEDDLGYVFLVRMAAEAENVSRLESVRIAQDAMMSVLQQFRSDPDSLGNRLDTEKSINMYYGRYLKCYIDQCGNPMNFPVTVKGVPTSIVDLLSDNPEFVRGRCRWLKQAFKTAGEEFQVISEDGKISVVVPYSDVIEKKLLDLEMTNMSICQMKSILRELQPYTISISQTERDKIGPGIYGILDGRVLVLEKRFYDSQLGMITDPGPMPDLQM